MRHLALALALAPGAMSMGTSEDPCVSTNCDGSGVCTFTATVDPFAGPTGYFKFDECGDVANPVITMKQGTTYVFDQSDNSNWYHPLGWAYFVDGAHEDVDELEPSISQSGNGCTGSNSCQAPMYYKNGVFAGAGTYPASGNDGDFGLDAYEPEFFIRKEDWLGTNYFVALTLTDTAYATDIFYFCHIHGGMSGYIKIADSTGTVISTRGTGTALIAADSTRRPRPTTRRAARTVWRTTPRAAPSSAWPRTSSAAAGARSRPAASASASTRWTAPWTTT